MYSTIFCVAAGLPRTCPPTWLWLTRLDQSAGAAAFCAAPGDTANRLAAAASAMAETARSGRNGAIIDQPHQAGAARTGARVSDCRSLAEPGLAGEPLKRPRALPFPPGCAPAIRARTAVRGRQWA